MKTVAILGSTGSIGKNTLKVITQLKDNFKVIALAAGSNSALLAEHINQFRPRLAAIMQADKFSTLKKAVHCRHTKLSCGTGGVEQVASCGADIVVLAIGGSSALIPTLKALGKTKRLALANKECLVMAGELIMQKSRRWGTEIIPIDSEHSAIFQCLKQENKKSIAKIYLTGSGGPLKDISEQELEFVQPDFALRHPRWKMGKKISIDSATLINKGFELIEAKYLFNCPVRKIEILIHPEAIVHSLVQFVDGSTLAQLGRTDMRIPIQYALTYPQRMPSGLAQLDLSQTEKLTFYPPNLNKFPCLGLAIEVARQKGLSGTVLAACDEECVWAYLKGEIKITDFARIIEQVLSKLRNKLKPSLAEILETDQWAREEVKARI